MPIRPASLLALALLAGPAAAFDRADCDAPGHARTLHAAADPRSEARAAWLDARTLRWPGQPAEGRYRILHSATAALRATPGSAAVGADGAIELAVRATPLAKDLDERFRWLGDGVLLALPEKAAAERDAAARGQALLVREDAQGRVLAATLMQWPGALDERYAPAASITLGAVPGADRTDFALWAPTAQRVAACLHASGAAPAAALAEAARDDDSGVWRVARDGNLAGQYYTWLVDVFVPGVGIVRNRVTDPYALSLTTDSTRAWIGSLDDPATRPAGWDAQARPQRVRAAVDMVIWELHVRDFSIGDESVPAGRRGRYLAFAEADSQGVRHLRALSAAGVTDVHLLPAYDISSVPESGCVTPQVEGPPDGTQQQAAIRAVAARDCFNWGYDPQHFTAPEGSYASDPADGAVRVREFRAMVQALHALDLRVGMDVVYNHTSHAGQHERSVLDRIVPGYYHRLDAAGRIERSTCCENTATEHRMMAKLMIDSAVVWARDYRIDSFRFDLMGHQPRRAMEDLQRAVDGAAGRRVQLIGEGWNFGEVADGARFVQASQRSLYGAGIGTFSDRARDAVRGGGPGDNDQRQISRQGWANGLHYAPNALAPRDAGIDALRAAADLVRVGLAGSLRDYRLLARDGREVALSAIDYNGQPAGYVAQPGEVVNYVENHDNQTLYDVNVFKLPRDTSPQDRARVQVLALATVAFSQGIAYFHAGGEILRSKSMDRNSFDSGDWFNRVDWSGRENAFGSGLPPAGDNERSWPLMRPLLADTALRPRPAEIAWTRDAFLDLLRTRGSTPLFRLRTAEAIGARLRFPDAGPTQSGSLLVGRIDGAAYPGARFGAVLYALNADLREQVLTLPEEAGQGWRLHPVHAEGADARPREQARYDAASGSFRIPPRTAVVWVRGGADP
jgi:pullulanase/glycogen debranching enzyme